jgi:hypothetical protein
VSSILVRSLLRVVFSFTITFGKIVEIDTFADPSRPRQLELTVLADGQ